MLRRAGDAAAVEPSLDAVAKATGGPIDDGEEIVALLLNEDRLGPANIGGDVAELVNAAARAVQVGEANGDSNNAGLMAVYCKLDASFDALPHLVIPLEIASANCDFHDPSWFEWHASLECNRFAIHGHRRFNGLAENETGACLKRANRGPFQAIASCRIQQSK